MTLARHIGDVRRTDREVYRVSFIERRGRTVVDLRRWERYPGPAKALGPTRDGLEIEPEHLNEVIDALVAASFSEDGAA